MQINYTPEKLLFELQTQGVLIEPTKDGNIFLDGEMSDAQLFAIKEFKPQIISLIEQKQVYRFGINDSLLFDLSAAFEVFDVSNKSANLFFLALLKYSEQCEAKGAEMICFCQPSIDAYKANLRLCAALQLHTNDNLQTVFDEFIKTHTLGVPLGEWVQDIPLWQVKIYDGETMIDFAVCNAIQAAIFCGFYSTKNPDVTDEIKMI